MHVRLQFCSTHFDIVEQFRFNLVSKSIHCVPIVELILSRVVQNSFFCLELCIH